MALIPLNEPALTADARWVLARNVHSGDLLMGRRGKPVMVDDVVPYLPMACYRITLTDGSWFRTTSPSSGDEPVEFPTLDTNGTTVKAGPHLPVKSVQYCSISPVIAITVEDEDADGWLTEGLLVVRNYVCLDASE